MDNKKKILIPMIFVVILLIIAVIGITYAFFAANNTASGTTILETTAESIGVVTVQNPTEELHLNLTAANMAITAAGTSYWATAEPEARYQTTEEYYTVARFSITGGSDTTRYSCGVDVKITPPDIIKDGDMGLGMFIIGENVDSISVIGNNGEAASEYCDLKNNCYYGISFTATGNVSGELLALSLKLNNTDGDQNYLAGQTLSTSISVSDLSCSVIKN